MTREEHLKQCSICEHRKQDWKRGLLCGLTNELADFEGECPSFRRDEVEVIEQTKRQMALEAEDQGDPHDYKRNQQVGIGLMVVAAVASVVTIALSSSTGIYVVFIGKFFLGIWLYEKGRKQEKILQDYERDYQDHLKKAEEKKAKSSSEE